jgi:hypothetical protein
MKKKQVTTFPMKRTAYIEFIGVNKVIIGTPLKNNKAFGNKSNAAVNLVSLDVVPNGAAYPPFFADISKDSVGVYFMENGAPRLIGTVSPGQVQRFTCTVPEVA